MSGNAHQRRVKRRRLAGWHSTKAGAVAAAMSSTCHAVATVLPCVDRPGADLTLDDIRAVLLAEAPPMTVEDLRHGIAAMEEAERASWRGKL